MFDNNGENLTELLDTLIDKKKELKDLEFDVKELKEQITELQEHVFDVMTESGVRNINIRDKMLYLNPRRFISVKAAYRPEGFEWLRQNGYSHLIKNVEQVHSGTLTAELKLRLEEGGEIPEEFFNNDVKKIIGVRKAKRS